MNQLICNQIDKCPKRDEPEFYLECPHARSHKPGPECHQEAPCKVTLRDGKGEFTTVSKCVKTTVPDGLVVR